ncbi:hypothetical protein ACRRTK_010383 [Alexandromys fortis]
MFCCQERETPDPSDESTFTTSRDCRVTVFNSREGPFSFQRQERLQNNQGFETSSYSSIFSEGEP